jgi:hypothetical protein
MKNSFLENTKFKIKIKKQISKTQIKSHSGFKLRALSQEEGKEFRWLQKAQVFGITRQAPARI